MYPSSFEYVAPSDLGEATALLARFGEEAKVLAGGQSLIPLMKLRLARPACIVDIGRLPGLEYVQDNGGNLAIGALATHAGVLKSPLIHSQWPLVADAVSVIGDPQVRNWGTVGGALAEADPAGDWGVVALALRARIRCASVRGARWLAADSFFIDAYTTQLASDELITEVVFPAPSQGEAGAYLKLERRAGDFAVVSVAVQLAMEKNSVCTDSSVALGAAGLTPVPALQAAAWLRGRELRPDVVQQAAELLAGEVEPLADIRGSEDYKRAAAQALFKQAIGIAQRRWRGERVEAGHVR